MTIKNVLGFVKRSLVLKSILAFVIPMTAIIIFVLIYFPKQLEGIMYKSAQTQVRLLGQSLAFSVEQALENSNFRYVDSTFLKIKENPHVFYAGIFDEKGVLIIDHAHDQNRPDFKIPYGITLNKSNNSYFNKVRVGTKSKFYGTVIIAYSMDYAKEKARHDQTIIFLVCAALLLLGTIVIVAIYRKVTGDLRKLISASQKAGEGNLTGRINIKSSDEVGVLAVAFNKMMQSISDANTALENEKNSVQQKVNEAVAQLNEAMAFIGYVINSIPIAIISIDRGNNIIQYNHTAVKLLPTGYSPIHQNLFSVFPEYGFIKEQLRSSESEKDETVQSYSIVGADGNLKYYSVSVYPLKTEVNPGSVIMLEDITEKKHIEQLMIQNEKMSSVAGLAAGMAHEINNPLGTIVQGCQNILRRTSKDMPKNQIAAEKIGIEMNQILSYFQEREIDQIIDSIKNAAGKASEIIKNMLQFSRKSESKKINYKIEKLIEETIELANKDYNLKKKYDFRSINIIREYAENLPEMWITVTEIQQVIFNMLQNSAQAMRAAAGYGKEPEIKISVRRDDEEAIKIEIEDNGMGMDENTRRRVFEPFFTTKEIGEGTGLGLSVSYMIIKNNHNGNIAVQSQLGKGTIFYITLPLKRESNETKKTVDS